MKTKYTFSKLIIIIGTAVMIIGFVHFSFSQFFNSANDENVETGEADISNTTVETYNGQSSLDDSEFIKIQSELIKVSSLYKDIHKNAEKKDAPNWDYDSDYAIDRKSLDRIEDILIENEYLVINSDTNYPEYLENAYEFYDFWTSVENNRDDEITFLSITNSGGLLYKSLQYLDGKATSVVALANWSEKEELAIDYAFSRQIHKWGMTSSGDFYYQDLTIDRHWDATTLLRLNPVDKELYDYNKKYIEPIGYQGVNLFLSEWSTDDFSNLCLNDLFDMFYKMKNDKFVSAEDYKEKYTPYYYYCIPSEIFEETVLPYFDISIEKFRDLTLYDKEEDIYPWIETSVSNISYYPTIIPEIIKVEKHDSGKVTLTVNALCLDKGTDSLFVHEVSILPQQDGTFKYLGNKIISKGEHPLPSNVSRFEAASSCES